MQILTQRVEQRGAWIECQPMLCTVDTEHNLQRSRRAAGILRYRWRDSGHERSSHKSSATGGCEHQHLSSCDFVASHGQAILS
jgi:hypothetical protein